MTVVLGRELNSDIIGNDICRSGIIFELSNYLKSPLWSIIDVSSMSPNNIKII